MNNGIFIGFHGRFGTGGLRNEENPLVYVDLATLTYFHFIGVDEAGIGHLDGLLATDDSLFVADLASNGSLNNGGGTGVIYQIKSLARPRLSFGRDGGVMNLSWTRGVLQEADDPAGAWRDLPGAKSPYAVAFDQTQKFYRLKD